MYEFEHVTSSPVYPQRNGKVEIAVKTAKNLMKKSASASSDFHLTLLDWRNTPTEGMKSSLAQRMFGRCTRTLLPISKKLLKPQLITDVRERKLQRKEVQTRYYNQNVKGLPSLIIGYVVRMKPQASDGKQRWTKAQVEQQVDDRSYVVRTEDGRLFRRNWRHLRQSKKPFMPEDTDVEIPSPFLNSPRTTASTETVSGENSAGRPTALSRKQPEPGPPATCPAPLAECQKSNAVTRSGRFIRPPPNLMLNICRIFPEHFSEHLCEHFIVTFHCFTFFYSSSFCFKKKTKKARCNVIMSRNRLCHVTQVSQSC